MRLRHASHITVVLSKAAHSGPVVCLRARVAPPLVGSRSPDGWDQIPRWAGGWACTSHPGVLGSIPKYEEPGKTGRHPVLKYRVPHGSQMGRERVLLLVLNSVTSTPQWIRQPKAAWGMSLRFRAPLGARQIECRRRNCIRRGKQK